MTVLSIDLGKTNSVACWYQTGGQALPAADCTHEFRTVKSHLQDFHDLLTDRPVEQVVIEICDMAGWVVDLCRTLGIKVQVANANTEGWRWKNVKKKTDRDDALKLARL